jgi:predicted GTPase
MKRMAELCVPTQYWYNGPLSFRDEKTGVGFEIRRRVKPSLWYDIVDDADKDPEYAEQRDYIASIDLLIFVVDSQRERVEAGTGYLEDLRTAFTRLGRAPDLLPVLFQLNKRDLPGVVAESELRELFRAPRGSYVPTSARHGEGIDQLIAAAVRLATPRHG